MRQVATDIEIRRNWQQVQNDMDAQEAAAKQAVRKFYARQRLHDKHAIPLFPPQLVAFRFLRRYWKPFVLSCAVIAAVALLFVIGAFSL